VVAGFKASGVTMSTREPSAELSTSSSSRNMKNPTGWENSTRTSMSLSSFCSPQYHLKNCLNSSTVISACLRMAISVPFFNSLCRGTENTRHSFYTTTWLEVCRLISKPRLARSFTNFSPEITGSLRGICHFNFDNFRSECVNSFMKFVSLDF